MRPPRQANAREGDAAQDKPEVTVTVSQPKLAPAKSGARQGGYSSEVLLFEEGEPPRSVWSSPDELVFDLAPDGDAPSVLAATGPNGKLYRLGPSLWSLDRTFDEKQVTALAGNAVATNSASALYRFSDGPRQGEYVSAVKDTGRTSRFGAFRVEADTPESSRVGFSFRSGEAGLRTRPGATGRPMRPWGRPRRSAPRRPRFLQWKVRMRSDGAKLPVVRRVEAAYRNRNAAPVIDSFLALGPAEVLARSASGEVQRLRDDGPRREGDLHEPRRVAVGTSSPRLLRKGYRTLTWKATDADSDTLTYEIEFKSERSAHWLPLKKGLREAFYSFAALPTGTASSGSRREVRRVDDLDPAQRSRRIVVGRH